MIFFSFSFWYRSKAAHSTSLGSWDADLNPGCCLKDIVPSEGPFVIWASSISEDYEVGLYSCYILLESIQLEMGGWYNIMLGFHINTSKIVRLSFFFSLSLNEVYYLEVSPEMWLPAVCMSTEDFKCRVWVALCRWLENHINLCPRVKPQSVLKALGERPVSNYFPLPSSWGA